MDHAEALFNAGAKMFSGPSTLSESDLMKIQDLDYSSVDHLRNT